MEHFASDYDVEKAIAEYEGLPYLAKKDCNCWDGYERVPGTKPCAPGSCRKCDDHRESSVKNSGFMQEIINMYASSPAFARALATALQTVTRATGQGLKGANFGALGEMAKQAFQLWKEGKLALDDIDQVLLGNNIFGQTNLSLPGRPDDLKNMQNVDWQTATTAKIASQGDKPSPKAAQAVFSALAEGNEDAAIELLGHTDCPEGCETHPEGKCNHQYMSAGRTRVRYLVNDKSFEKTDSNPKGEGTVDHESAPADRP